MRRMNENDIGYLRETPIDWPVVPGKTMFAEVKNKNTDGAETTALKFTYGEIVRKENFDASSEEYVAETIKTYNRVKPNDVIINGLNLNYDFVSQRVAIVRENGVITSAYLVLRPKSHVNPRYLNYLLKSCDNMKVFHGMGEGIRQTIKFEDLGNMTLVCPAREEQDVIAAYLDTKCAAIDEAIERHKMIIERLEEYKRASIIAMVSGRPEHDVRKSGIPWMPAVPSGWDIIPLRFALTPRKNKNEGMAEDNLLTLSYGKIKRKSIDTNEGLLPASFEGYNIVEAGDIVLRLIDLQNDKHSLRTGLVTERGIITSAYVTVTPSNRFVPAFMRYLLHAYDLMKVFYSMGEGVRQGLSYDDLGRNLLIPCPPKEVQEGIASEIEKLENKVDAAIEKQDVIIAKLEEYRKTIIYNAVTGKIDCRTEASSQA